MSDTKFVAHCADCGHAYKVPSETKVYPCKECGGKVCAQVEDEEPEEELEEVPQHRSISQRHPRAKSSKTPMIIGVTVIGLALVGALGYAQNWFTFLSGAEPDFNKVAEAFVADWNSRNLDALEAAHHPSKQAEFGATLATISSGRGWSTAFPNVTSETHRISKGTVENPEQAIIDIKFTGLGLGAEEAEGWGTVSWQFEPSHDRWYIFDLTLAPSSLEPRARAFQEAWASSDLNALRPFFLDAEEKRMIDLFSKWGEIGGWQGEHPPITGMSSSGEEVARKTSAHLYREEVLTTYQTGKGPLTIKWAYSGAEDTWNVKGLKESPK